MTITPPEAARGALREDLNRLSEQLLADTTVGVVLDSVRHLHGLLTLSLLPNLEDEFQIRQLLDRLTTAVIRDQPIDRAAYTNRVTRECDRL